MKAAQLKHVAEAENPNMSQPEAQPPVSLFFFQNIDSTPKLFHRFS